MISDCVGVVGEQSDRSPIRIAWTGHVDGP